MVFKGGLGEGQQDARVATLAKDIERIDFELKRLRDWRHGIGEKPGYAATVRLDDYKVLQADKHGELDRRVARIERAMNGLLQKE